MLWNKWRLRGKLLCFFARKDKSVVPALCALRNDFIVFKERAYDVYPDFVRFMWYPMGWPRILQELTPSSLYDEEDAIPLDWVVLGDRKVRAMELKAALDENWLRKLVAEVATEGKAPFNWKRILPIALLVLGVVGLIVILSMKGCTLPGAGKTTLDLISMVGGA